MWNAETRTLGCSGVSRQFSTTIRVAIVANDWETSNADVAASEDSGHVGTFSPSPVDVHREAARWFGDQEIFDFLGAYLHLLEQHSLRTYVLAAELKAAGLDWRSDMLGRCPTGTALLVAQLKVDPRYATENERVQAFIEAGGGCRATYLDHARKLSQSGSLPVIKLACHAAQEGAA